MKQKNPLFLYILLAFLMLVDFYLIFNVGNPNSLLRFLIPSTEWDMAATLAVSLLIAFLSFFVFKDRSLNPVATLLKQNSSYISELRKEGKSDNEIVDSFIQELNPRPYARKRIRKMVFKALEEGEA